VTATFPARRAVPAADFTAPFSDRIGRKPLLIWFWRDGHACARFRSFRALTGDAEALWVAWLADHRRLADRGRLHLDPTPW